MGGPDWSSTALLRVDKILAECKQSTTKSTVTAIHPVKSTKILIHFLFTTKLQKHYPFCLEVMKID